MDGELAVGGGEFGQFSGHAVWATVVAAALDELGGLIRNAVGSAVVEPLDEVRSHVAADEPADRDVVGLLNRPAYQMVQEAVVGAGDLLVFAHCE